MDYASATGAVVDVGGAQSIERASTLLRAVGRGGEGGASLTELVAISGLSSLRVRCFAVGVDVGGPCRTGPGHA